MAQKRTVSKGFGRKTVVPFGSHKRHQPQQVSGVGVCVCVCPQFLVHGQGSQNVGPWTLLPQTHGCFYIPDSGLMTNKRGPINYNEVADGKAEFGQESNVELASSLYYWHVLDAILNAVCVYICTRVCIRRYIYLYICHYVRLWLHT